MITSSKSKLNNENKTKNENKYFSPPIVDYKCEKQHYNQSGIINLPIIQISNEELEYYENEVELFFACYKKYAPLWPEKKIGFHLQSKPWGLENPDYGLFQLDWGCLVHCLQLHLIDWKLVTH